MEIDTHTSFDKILIAKDPFYGLRLKELLVKIEYLKQKLFWTRSVRLDCLVHSHQRVLVQNYSRETGDNLIFMGADNRRELLEKTNWKNSFENLLKKHEISFQPGETHKRYVMGADVAFIDSHLCSGRNGDWIDCGYGLKFFSSPMERQKYKNLAEDLTQFLSFSCPYCGDDHRFQATASDLCDQTLLSDIKGVEESDPLIMIDTLNHDFVDLLDFDNLIFCCTSTFDNVIAKLRRDVEIIEQHIFWVLVHKYENSLIKIINVHKSHHCRKKLKCLTPGDKDWYLVWKNELEKIFSDCGLSFSSGSAKVCEISNMMAVIDGTLDTHLCSGKDGNWSSGVGFGKLMVTDKSARKRFLNLVKHLGTYII